MLALVVQAAVLAAGCHDAEVVGGGGGEAGAPGEGGAGGLADDGVPRLKGWLAEEYDWMLQPERWTLLPGSDQWDPDCWFRQADPGQIAFPPLRWEACGEGCERASILEGTPPFVQIDGRPNHHATGGGISLALREGQPPRPILGAVHPIKIDTANGLTINRTVDLLTGQTVAAVQAVLRRRDQYAQCPSGRSPDSGFSYGFAATPVSVRGAFDVTNGRYVWPQPWRTKATFEAAGGHGLCTVTGSEQGRLLWSCISSLILAPELGSSELVRLAEPAEEGCFTRYASVLGESFVWPEVCTRRDPVVSRVRMWTPEGGLRTLLDEIPDSTEAVGLGDAHAVGFSQSGLEKRLWVARRTEDDTLADLRFSPVIWRDAVAVSSNLTVTWGDHAAVSYIPQRATDDGPRGRLLLVRTGDWAMREIRGPPGEDGTWQSRGATEVWSAALTDTHLYVIHSLWGANVGDFDYVYRYDLAKFDSIGTPIVPIGDAPPAD